MATTCSVCGEKLGLGGGKPLAPGFEQYPVCGYCGGQLSTIERDRSSDFAKNAKDYFQGLMAKQEMPQAVFDYLNELVIVRMTEEEKALQQQEAARLEKEQAYRKKLDAIKITSTHNIEGWRITEYAQFVSSELVVGMGIFKAFLADLANITGMRSGALSDKLADAKHDVQLELRREADRLGCNAVIGVDLEYTMFGDTMVGVIMSGTAVKVKPLTSGNAKQDTPNSDESWGTPEKCETCDEQGMNWGAPKEKPAAPQADAWGTPEKCESCDEQGMNWGAKK